MRFVFVCHRLERIRGGIERHAVALSDELTRRGHATTIVEPGAMRRTDAGDADWVVFDGVHRLAMLRHARPGEPTPRFALFPHASYLAEVHSAELRADGGWTPRFSDRGRLLFDRVLGARLARRFDRVFALTASESDDLRAFLHVPSDRITVLGPFVTAEFLRALAAPAGSPPAAGPYVVSVSRIEARKNFGSLLRALDGSPIRFILAGQDRGGLAELGLAARATPGTKWEYLGEVSEQEKVRLMRGAVGVVVPSTAEGVPAVAIEALVLGRPVVLAGVAYGPDHPGVVRCRPDAGALRAAVDSLAGRPAFPALEAPTVAAAADRFLAALSGGAVP